MLPVRGRGRGRTTGTSHHRHRHRRRRHRRRRHRLWPTMHCTGVRAPLPYPDTARLSPPACHRERWFPTDFDWWAAQQIVQLKLGREATKVFLYGNGTCNEPGVFCHLPLLPPPPFPLPCPQPPYTLLPHTQACAPSSTRANAPASAGGVVCARLCSRSSRIGGCTSRQLNLGTGTVPQYV